MMKLGPTSTEVLTSTEVPTQLLRQITASGKQKDPLHQVRRGVLGNTEVQEKRSIGCTSLRNNRSCM